jgi:hypothetical protein
VGYDCTDIQLERESVRFACRSANPDWLICRPFWVRDVRSRSEEPSAFLIVESGNLASFIETGQNDRSSDRDEIRKLKVLFAEMRP